MSKRKTKPTPMQKKAIDNVMSGKFKTKKEALLDAGYSESTADTKSVGRIVRSAGGQAYLEQFSEKAKARYGMTIESKLQDVYLDGLEADRPWGKNDIMPDYKVRKDYADKIAEMLGWIRQTSKSDVTFNFFMMDKKDRSKFNDMFSDFVRQRSLED